MIKCIKHKGKIISNIELANTPLKKRLGLMFRINPPESSMLFEINEHEISGIHMLFMFFPTDVILLNKKLAITKMATMRPFRDYMPVKNTSYILESKEGTIKDFNLRVGDTLQFETT